MFHRNLRLKYHDGGPAPPIWPIEEEQPEAVPVPAYLASDVQMKHVVIQVHHHLGTCVHNLSWVALDQRDRPGAVVLADDGAPEALPEPGALDTKLPIIKITDLERIVQDPLAIILDQLHDWLQLALILKQLQLLHRRGAHSSLCALSLFHILVRKTFRSPFSDPQ